MSVHSLKKGDTIKTTKTIQKGLIAIPEGKILSVKNVSSSNALDVIDIETNVLFKNFEHHLFNNCVIFSVADHLHKQVIEMESEREDEHLLDLEFI